MATLWPTWPRGAELVKMSLVAEHYNLAPLQLTFRSPSAPFPLPFCSPSAPPPLPFRSPSANPLPPKKRRSFFLYKITHLSQKLLLLSPHFKKGRKKYWCYCSHLLRDFCLSYAGFFLFRITKTFAIWWNYQVTGPYSSGLVAFHRYFRNIMM